MRLSKENSPGTEAGKPPTGQKPAAGLVSKGRTLCRAVAPQGLETSTVSIHIPPSTRLVQEVFSISKWERKTPFLPGTTEAVAGLWSRMGLPGGAGASAGLSVFPGPISAHRESCKQHSPEGQHFPESQQNVLQGLQ